MPTKIDLLIQLQEHDQKLLGLVRELNEIPKRKEAITSKLNRSKEAVAKAKEELMHVQSEIKDLENRIESAKQRVIKYKNQQFEVKDNESYRVLDREIREVERDVRRMEDEEIGQMEKVDPLNSRIADAEAVLSEETGAVEKEISELDAREAAVSLQADAMRDERKGMVGDIDRTWLSRYERIIQHKGDIALVNAFGGTCSGCNMKLQPQLVHDAKKADQLTACSYCGRILYYAE